MDFGFDPVDGKGEEAGAAVGFVAFDGFHQADVAFLDEVGLVEAVAVVAAGDGDDDAQVGQDELFGGFDVAAYFAFGEVVFFFGGEHGDAVDGVDVLFQAAVSAGDGEGDGLTCGHWCFLKSDGVSAGTAVPKGA